MKSFFDKILAGLSLGIVVALIPSALLGELMKALSQFDFAAQILLITNLAVSMVPAAIGIGVGLQFKFTPIQTISLAIACFAGSGVLKKALDKGFVIGGTGDVINTALVAIIGAFIIMQLGNSLKAYAILLIPMIVVVVAGGIGMFTLPYVSELTRYIGSVVKNVTTWQPHLMGIVISIIFALLIVSPFSTVGIAIAIQIGGIASGAANLGIVAVGFGLAISGWRKNSFGTSIAHFLGSPKMQMANFVKKPIMIVPMLANAAVLGLLAAIFDIKGTAFSAGFGISGLIGPINAYNTGTNFVIIALVFVILPVALGIGFDYVFKKIVPIVKDEDYQINYQ